ncbi:type III secretion system export apparatus subunit SctR [Achromobacter xylosoxidans]|uniref:type III secretion system export apparatus subunit SctR n=1 Tax=Alcaligenes xylosoxydans xylosoxydans TaxID=85698 RepID=UPI0001F43D3F|nr:type III secretion system export apparatus subunit SctR [Achromobacter xylosoxidans]EFV87688.1 type III secretion protein [Achromobacter xylosoxidans C54]MDC6165065.1 type III secretion system export apparatus subunit SctR [Achromobacter xylosoxidans]CUJ26678.1 Flagellar biosynthetic protein fliP precursor [Achromobacter xylosoxidans]CUJ91156.1 Flagellar biosynthetic protein fliP precursor [Achromobacter xylosoxidans]CUR67722.1 Flagellar biosynthetic protein FliP precursor [Achromobacter xy
MSGYDPITLALALSMVALVPLAVVMTTSFLKISVVLVLVRNALGIQQAPPNMALYGLAVILSAYVMAPVGYQISAELRAVASAPATESGAPGTQGAQAGSSLENFLDVAARAAEPMRGFMLKNSRAEQRDFFVRTARQLWGPEQAAALRETDLIVLVPAFLLSELTVAFQVGFLLYLPFVVIDLIVSNILMAMGMMMVSPVTISMPLKLFLFVMVDGWSRLIQGLVLSYA